VRRWQCVWLPGMPFSEAKLKPFVLVCSSPPGEAHRMLDCTPKIIGGFLRPFRKLATPTCETNPHVSDHLKT